MHSEKMQAEMSLAENGDVGADHDELAMRHVDDTHGAVSDGEPESDQQQNGRKTQPDENYVGHTMRAVPVPTMRDSRLTGAGVETPAPAASTVRS